MVTIMRGTRATRYAVVLLVAVLVAAGAAWWVFRDVGTRQITAYFDRTVSLYPGSSVRVLGVRVGSVDDVQPGGRRVTVTMTVDRGVAVPADATAVVVKPSVVTGRYVQLAPAYTGGPRMAAGATIPNSRTVTPVELDQLYENLRRLARALGPRGANANGALSDLLDTGAANLRGNGDEIGEMIEELGKAARTLSGSREDLFATVGNLQSFTTMLKNNDSQVRRAVRQLAQVSEFLAEDRDELGAALEELAAALEQVRHFIENNRELLASNVDKLASITQILVDQRRSLAEALDVAPLAATNLVNTYNPESRTLDGRINLNELSVGAGPRTVSRPAPPAGRQPEPASGQSSPPVLPLPAVGETYSSPQSAGGGGR